MAVICPTVLAPTIEEYNSQIKKLTSLASRIQIDLADGEFTGPKTLDLKDVWWPHSLEADLHLMYQRPIEHLQEILHLRPHLVIVHVEAEVHHMHFAAELHKEGIRAGLAILPDTPVANAQQIMHSFDHVLIFGGHLGHFGGEADLSQLHKVQEAKAHHPDLEIGWDGGVNDQNAKQLADGGVDVLNVGGFIQNSQNPSASFQILQKLV